VTPPRGGFPTAILAQMNPFRAGTDTSGTFSRTQGGGLRALLVLVALLFGFATIVAGTRVLTGSDPGYAVLQPLLFYNVAMGVAYVAAGVLAWRDLGWGMRAAAAIFVLNLVVLAAIAWLHSSSGAVAIESVRAMILRTAVWLMLFLGLRRLDRSLPPA